jgi:hypothetical protein
MEIPYWSPYLLRVPTGDAWGWARKQFALKQTLLTEIGLNQLNALKLNHIF